LRVFVLVWISRFLNSVLPQTCPLKNCTALKTCKKLSPASTSHNPGLLSLFQITRLYGINFHTASICFPVLILVLKWMPKIGVSNVTTVTHFDFKQCFIYLFIYYLWFI
jgi:hypothetical protein